MVLTEGGEEDLNKRCKDPEKGEEDLNRTRKDLNTRSGIFEEEKS